MAKQDIAFASYIGQFMATHSPAEQIEALRDFLRTQIAIEGDIADWGASALTSWLGSRVGKDSKPLSLDQAFGLKVDGRKAKELTEYRDWTPQAWLELTEALRTNPDGETETSIKARIGRKFGLGGIDAEFEEDRAVASELTRALDRYVSVIADFWGAEITRRRASKNDLRDVDTNRGE